MAELQMFQPGKTFYDAFQQGRGNTLAKLAITGDETQRKGALADLYGLNPEMAQAAQSQIKANDQQDYSDVVEAAKLVHSFRNDPEMEAQAYARFAPKFSQKYGMNLPPQIDQTVRSSIDQIVGAQGGKPKARSSHILADGTIAFMDEYGNLTKTGEKASNSFRPIVGANGEIVGFDPRFNVANPTGTGEGGQVQPPKPDLANGDPMNPVHERINYTAKAMKDAGVPVEQINAWADNAFAEAQKELGATGVTTQEPAPPPQTARVSVKPKEAPAGYQYNAAGTLEPIKGGPADPANKEKAAGLGDTNTLRDDYTKAIQQPVAVMNAYEKMRDAAQDPSPAGDIALIYAYMKILDPTSVVREGEFATAQNAGSVPDSVRNTWNKLVNGERLAINRGDFLLQGAKLYASSKQQYNQVRQQFKGIAERNGVNTADVLVDSHKPISQRYPAQGQVYKPQTDADFAKIPKGGLYIDPDDGKQYRKK